VTDFVLIYESVTSTATALNDDCRTNDSESRLTLELNKLSGELHIHPHVLEFLCYSVIPLSRKHVLASCCLAMNFRSGSTIPAFRRHVTVYKKLHYKAPLIVSIGNKGIGLIQTRTPFPLYTHVMGGLSCDEGAPHTS
jgi:hypothetical protein